jgi:hypothetical protein
MAQKQRAGALEIDQQLDVQRRTWTVQRYGWAVMGLLILAALLGLFGSGPLSHTTIGTPDGALELQYERFWRLLSPTTLRVTLRPAAAHDKEVSVWLSQRYLDRVVVRQVTPQPRRVEAEAERLHYTFSASQMGPPITVSFNVEPEQSGRVTGRLGLASGQVLDFTQFIYP